jgi:hypothetical protein
MTLREYLNRRSLRANIVAAIGVAVVWAITIRAPKGSLENTLVGWAFVGGIACSLLFSRRARCPRCGAAIGYIDTSEARSHKRWRQDAGLNWCGNCGLHLDEQILPSNREQRLRV